MRTTMLVAAALAFTGTGPDPVGIREAHAVIGRPLTPMSYAGVARRTARRTTYRTMAYGGYGATGYITALPSGCVMGGGVYTCGAVRYRPYYNGPTLVYMRI